MLKKNVGTLDRAVRLLLGIGLLSLLFILDSPLRWFGLLGIAPLLTVVVRWCPVYGLFRVSTK